MRAIQVTLNFIVTRKKRKKKTGKLIYYYTLFSPMNKNYHFNNQYFKM